MATNTYMYIYIYIGVGGFAGPHGVLYCIPGREVGALRRGASSVRCLFACACVSVYVCPPGVGRRRVGGWAARPARLWVGRDAPRGVRAFGDRGGRGGGGKSFVDPFDVIMKTQPNL